MTSRTDKMVTISMTIDEAKNVLDEIENFDPDYSMLPYLDRLTDVLVGVN